MIGPALGGTIVALSGARFDAAVLSLIGPLAEAQGVSLAPYLE